MLLLHYDACATVINGTAQVPKDVTQNAEIRGMLEGEIEVISYLKMFQTILVLAPSTFADARSFLSLTCLMSSPEISLYPGCSAAERTEERKLEEKLLEAAREGDLSTLSQLVRVNVRYLIAFLPPETKT